MMSNKVTATCNTALRFTVAETSCKTSSNPRERRPVITTCALRIYSTEATLTGKPATTCSGYGGQSVRDVSRLSVSSAALESFGWETKWICVVYVHFGGRRARTVGPECIPAAVRPTDAVFAGAPSARGRRARKLEGNLPCELATRPCLSYHAQGMAGLSPKGHGCVIE